MVSFEPRKSFEHIDKLSYEIGPRLAGSERSDEAAEYIKKQFEQLGLNTRFQNFEFVDRVTQSKARMIILGSLFLSFPFLAIYFGRWIALSAVLGGYLVYFLAPHLLPKKEDRNVVAVKEPEGDVEKRIVVGAHYDSAPCNESKNWGYFHRLALPPILAAFLALSIFTFFVESNLWLFIWIVLAPLTLLTFAAPFWIYSDLISPGTDDNASGVSVLLEVARSISEKQLDGTEVRFVAFGAEEQGLFGSKDFSGRSASPEFFLNLDSLGSGESLAVIRGNGIIRKRSTSEWLNEELSGGNGIEKVWTPLSAHDHIPFLDSNIEATTLTSTNPSEKNSLDEFFEKYFGLSNVQTDRLPYLHTLDDEPEKIRLENIKKSGRLVSDMLVRNEGNP